MLASTSFLLAEFWKRELNRAASDHSYRWVLEVGGGVVSLGNHLVTDFFFFFVFSTSFLSSSYFSYLLIFM